MTTTPTPAEIEAFQKGLKLGLVPEGWHPFTSEKPLWKCGFDSQGRYEDNPTALDIQAMEGLAGRVLSKTSWVVQCTGLPRWVMWDTNDAERVSSLPGTESEHLPALVDAVRRMRG